MPRLIPLIVLFVAVIAAVGVYTHAKGAGRSPIPAAVSDDPLAQAPGKQTAVFAGG